MEGTIRILVNGRMVYSLASCVPFQQMKSLMRYEGEKRELRDGASDSEEVSNVSLEMDHF